MSSYYIQFTVHTKSKKDQKKILFRVRFRSVWVDPYSWDCVYSFDLAREVVDFRSFLKSLGVRDGVHEQ